VSERRKRPCWMHSACSPSTATTCERPTPGKRGALILANQRRPVVLTGETHRSRNVA
jgi:hypothetical protein